jgi:hypothetical protein
MTQSNHLRRLRFWLALFIIDLVLSCITVFPLKRELSGLVSILHEGWLRPISEFTGLLPWIERVNNALRTTNAYYPFLAHGTELARIRSSIDRNRICESLHRASLQQVGYHFRADRLRWSRPACPHRRICLWHPAAMASNRLQFRNLRKCPASPLHAVSPSARTRTSLMKLIANSASAKSSQRSRPIAQSIVLMVATMIAGLTIRFVPLGLPPIIVKYGGSMLWAPMIYWIISALLPSLRFLVAALITASLTTAVEFYKLHHSPALDAFRLTIPGILLLGRVFSAWDIVAYWFAILIGIFVDSALAT